MGDSVQQFDSGQLKQDLKILGAYVRTEMFQRVKFIYSSEDLEHGGRIFGDFNKHCADRVARGIQEREKTNYLACLWKQALKMKVHRNQLSTRRSGVYTVMQNRFLGK
jgi:hypothetical protein